MTAAGQSQADEPRLLAGLVADWPAVGRWAPPDLARRFGAALVVVHLAAGPDRLSRTTMPLARALSLVADPPPATVVAVAGHPLAALGPGALAEAPAPAIVAPLDDPVGFLWVGPAGKRVPLHTDGEPGLLAQVFGHKRVRLISPAWGASVSPRADHPVLSTLRDAARAPELAGVPTSEVDLHPGDALWVPAGWWHQVDYFTTAVSVNFWPRRYLDGDGRLAAGGPPR